jgi:ribosomal-protein-alanine N-acetyltransferase
VPAGVRKRYYENVEDAIVMWCNDLALPDYRDRLRDLSPEVGR